MVEVTAGAEAAVVATAETEEELLVGGLYHGHRVQRLGHPGRPGLHLESRVLLEGVPPRLQLWQRVARLRAAPLLPMLPVARRHACPLPLVLPAPLPYVSLRSLHLCAYQLLPAVMLLSLLQ